MSFLTPQLYVGFVTLLLSVLLPAVFLLGMRFGAMSSPPPALPAQASEASIPTETKPVATETKPVVTEAKPVTVEAPPPTPVVWSERRTLLTVPCCPNAPFSVKRTYPKTSTIGFADSLHNPIGHVLGN